MIPKLLCLIGFHKWEVDNCNFDQTDPNTFLVYEKCECCGETKTTVETFDLFI